MSGIPRFQMRSLKIVMALSITGGAYLLLHQSNRRGAPAPQINIRNLDLQGHMRAKVEQTPPSTSDLKFETAKITFHAKEGATYMWSSAGSNRFKVQMDHLQFMGLCGPAQQTVRFAYIGRAAGDGIVHLGIMGWGERARFDYLESGDGQRRFRICDLPIATNPAGELLIYVDEVLTDHIAHYCATLQYNPYNRSIQIKSLIALDR